MGREETGRAAPGGRDNLPRRGAVSAPRVPRSSTAAMDEAWYLTAPSEQYRVIVRYCYDQHLAHHYHLSPEQILTHLRQTYSPGYDEDALRGDLAELVRRRNLDEDLELGLANAKTVDDFRRRNSMYAITPLTAELEDLRVRWENHGRQVGELDGAAIGRLWELLAGLISALDLPDRDPDRPEQVRQRWEDLYSRFEPMSRDANAYISNMRRQEREQLSDLDAFLVYKGTLVHYLTRFIEGLAEYRGRFWTRLARLPVEDAVSTLSAAALSGSKAFEDADHVRRQYAEQVRALVDWFAPHGDAEVLQGHATRAIEQVSRAALRLAESRVGAVSRSQELLALAEAFSRCADVRQAERLAGAVFGLGTPRHWELIGPEYLSEDPGTHTWQAPPTEFPLRRRRAQAPRRAESAVELAAADARRLRIRERSRERELEVSALIRLWFGSGPRTLEELGAAGDLDPRERDLLLEWVNDCLVHGGQARTDAGLTLVIENAGERRYVWVRAADGAVLAPNYRLCCPLEETTGATADA